MARTRLTVTEARWSALERLGLDRKRWNALDPLVRRAAVAGLWIAVGLVVIGVFGVFKWSIFAAAAIVFALAVPPYERLPLGRFVVPLAVLAIALAYPFFRGGLFGWPIFGPFPEMNTMVVMMVFVMMALGLNVVVGYAGLLDLGYVAFYAMGAYTVGWFASDLFGSGFNLTGGTQGIGPVDAPGFGSWINTNVGLPDNYLAPASDTIGFLSNSINIFYWTALLLVLFTVFCSVRLRDSRLGRAWVAIREDEIAAAAMGVPLMRTKTWA